MQFDELVSGLPEVRQEAIRSFAVTKVNTKYYALWRSELKVLAEAGDEDAAKELKRRKALTKRG